MLKRLLKNIVEPITHGSILFGEDMKKGKKKSETLEKLVWTT